MSNSQGNVSDEHGETVLKPRGADGRFTKGQKLTSEEASRMGKLSVAARRGDTGERDALLEEKGYNQDTAPAALKHCVNVIVRGKSNVIPAIREYNRWPAAGDNGKAAPAVTDPVSLVVEAVGAKKLIEICREARKVAGDPPRR